MYKSHHLQAETQKHGLWDCLESQLIGMKTPPNNICQLLFSIGIHMKHGGLDMLVYSIFHCTVESMDHGFNTNSRIVRVLPLLSMHFLGRSKVVQPLWELLSSTTIY